MYFDEPEGAMGFFDIFRRRPPIRDLAALADFLDSQAAFLAQKGIFEYSRARGGPHGNTLLREKAFQEAVETSRWQAYPLALAMIGETLEGALRPAAGAAEPAMRDGVFAQVMAVFDRHPVPATLGDAAWRGARDALWQRLQGAMLHPAKPVKDVVEPYAEAYLELMPIHERLRGRDFQALRNYLQVTLVNIHREFTERADMAALVPALARTGEAARIGSG
jgi:hypothetical protein